MIEYQGLERRRFVRVPFIFPVKYTFAGDEEKREFHALSDNLSEGGIKIICMHEVKVHSDPKMQGHRLIVLKETC